MRPNDLAQGVGRASWRTLPGLRWDDHAGVGRKAGRACLQMLLYLKWPVWSEPEGKVGRAWSPGQHMGSRAEHTALTGCNVT